MCKLLLVDDDEDDRLIFEEAVESISSEVQLMLLDGGIKLIDTLSASIPKLPKLIFLDLNMPAKNGFDCLHDIKTSQDFNGIAVVVYSTSSNDEDIKRAYDLGADAYLIKPNNFTLLRSSISKILGLNWQVHTKSRNMDTFLISR